MHNVFHRAGAAIAGVVIAAVVTFMLLPTPGSSEPVKQKANSFAVRDVRVFDGHRVIEHANVIVRDGLITAVGARAAVPADLPVYDGQGRTLIPGLIDSHVHTYGRSRRNALRFGVTTELGMGTDWHLLPAAKKQRASLAQTDKSDLWSAGMLATVPHGHGTEYGMPIDTLIQPSEAAHWVDQRIREGSDYIKIILDDGSLYGKHIPTLKPATVKALINAAHRHGKMAVIHIATRADAKLAVDDGVNGLVHVFADKTATPDLIDDIKERGTFVIATLSVYSTIGCGTEGENLLNDALIEPYLTDHQTAFLKRTFGHCQPAVLKTAMRNVRRLHAAGIPILAGTDAGNPGTAHGASLLGELHWLVKSGLTPTEALSAATALPAQYFQLGDRGRIAPGLRADLVLVKGNATADIDAVRNIDEIWMNGYRVDRAPTATPPTKAGAPAQPAPAAPLISDFDRGKIASRYGHGWEVTTDKLRGGASVAQMHLIDNGANGTAGALQITGTVKRGFAFPWAGVIFFPAPRPMGALDYSGTHTLSFWARGDGGTYTVMLFAGATMQAAAMPIMQHFEAGPKWQKISLPLSAFAGADLEHLRGIAFTAGPQGGDFRFAIDEAAIQ